MPLSPTRPNPRIIRRTACALLALAALLGAFASPAPAQDKPLIAVLKLDGVGTDPVETEAITDRLREMLLKSGQFKVVDRSQMEAILNEQALQQAGCTGQQCAAQVGQILGVRRIVTGKVVKFSDRMWQVSAMMIDVETAEALRADSVRHQGDIIALLDQQVPQLAQRLAAAKPGAVAAVPVAAAVAPTPAPATIARFQGEWLEMAPMATGRTDHAAAVQGQRIYVFGGSSDEGRALDSVEVYDAAANAWTAGPRLPEPRTLAAAAALGGQLYVIGGRGEQAYLERVDVLDPTGGVWSPGPRLPSARAGATAIVLGGRLYVLGGVVKGGGFLAEALVLDATGSGWEQAAPMKSPRAYATAQVLDGRLYVFAGESKSKGFGPFVMNISIRYAERYDPAHNRWQALEQMPKARSRLTSALIQGRIYVFGGYLGNIVNLSAYGEYHVYDPEKDAWVESGSMERVRAGHTTDVAEGRIYFIGGKPGEWARVTQLR